MGGRKSPVLLEFFRAARAFFLLWGVGLSLSYPIWSNEIPEVILLNDPSQSTTVFSDREVVDQLILRVNGGENQRSDFGRLIWLDRISSDYQAGITSYFQGAKSLVEESVRSGDSKRVFLAVTDSSFPDASMIRFENGDVLMQLTSGLLSMETDSHDRLVG